MILLKDYVKEVTPPYLKDYDSYKDIDDKGFVERYLEIFGLELDEFYYPKIEALENEFNPLSITNAGYLDYIAYMMGDLDNFAFDTTAYRRLLTHIISIYKVKGTAKSFKAILYALKIKVTAVINIAVASTLYDSGINYDDPNIAYDISCPTCSDYDLTATGLPIMTAALYNKVLELIGLVEPINAKLRNFTYNGDTVSTVEIEVFIDEDGDLVYNNDEDPDLELTLTVDGDLVVGGPNANRYYINEDGDLIWISY